MGLGTGKPKVRSDSRRAKLDGWTEASVKGIFERTQSAAEEELEHHRELF